MEEIERVRRRRELRVGRSTKARKMVEGSE